jgi:hypothetical protein
MNANLTQQHRPNLKNLMFGDGTPRKAFITAVCVGTLLTAINHGDQILAGSPPPLIKVLLTYAVPYCVTTWGAVTGKLSQLKNITPVSRTQA